MIDRAPQRSATSLRRLSRVPRGGRRCGGFSLIEILVAVAIVAIMALAVGLSAGSGGAARVQEREARRAMNLLDLACQRASISGRPHGWHVAAASYAFSRYDGHDFVLEGKDELRARELPSGMQLQLLRDGAGTPLDKGIPEQPQVVCWPNGEMTSFRAEFALGTGPKLALEGQIDASLSLHGDPAQ